MAKLQRKTAKLFAEDANAAIGGLAQFGSLASGTPNYSTDPDVIQALAAYKKGWSAAVLGTKSPAMEDRNALDYLLSYQQAYIMQRGIPEYLDTETYYEGSFVSKASGALYVSKVDNNTGHDPALDSTETYWMKFPTPAEVAANYVAKAGDTMTGALTVQANISSTGNITAGTSMNTVTPAANSNDTTVPTTEWVRTFLGSINMLGRMNFNAAVQGTLQSGESYTVPSKGYLILCVYAVPVPSQYGNSPGLSTAYVQGAIVGKSTTPDSTTTSTNVVVVPVSQNDVLSCQANRGSCSYTFAPQI